MNLNMRSKAIELLRWLRARLFANCFSSLITVMILGFAWKFAAALVDWGLIEAVWSPEKPQLCRKLMGQGACWAFVADKYRFILFGTYPTEAHWRPALAILILLGLYVLSASRRARGLRLAVAWLAGFAAVGCLMWGGLLGLPYVENERWGGLTLTLLLSTCGLAFAFPLALLLALARRSELPIVRWSAIAYIELVRGVPLVSLLFMASVMLPLFLPAGVSVNKLLRAQLAMILFAAAYLAEVVRGGLQAIPRQQEEAARALGLNYWQRTRFVILPQALRITIPPLVNTFIGFFKDTSLVVIIGLFDFLTTIKVSLGEPAWTGFGIEAYLFAAAGYFVFCYPMSRYSQTLERQRGPGNGMDRVRGLEEAR
jgi:general L-amino acid transport system permease protein